MEIDFIALNTLDWSREDALGILARLSALGVAYELVLEFANGRDRRVRPMYITHPDMAIVATKGQVERFVERLELPPWREDQSLQERRAEMMKYATYRLRAKTTDEKTGEEKAVTIDLHTVVAIRIEPTGG